MAELEFTSMLADPKANRLAHQIELEKLFSKNQLIPRIRQEFMECKDPDFHQHMIENEIPIRFGYDLLTQMALHKRTTLPILTGILRHHFNDSQLTVDMLQRAAEADLVDWSSTLGVFIVRFTLSQDVQDDLDRFQFPLPMVVRPRRLHCNNDTGYLMSGGSAILKKNHHEDDICLDHLNRANQVKFCINLETANMVQNQWRNLDKAKPGETKSDFDKRKAAFEKYDRTAWDVMEFLLQEGNEFYLTHKYDKRGRVYCQGYHVNYQGTPWNKAVIELADKEIVE